MAKKETAKARKREADPTSLLEVKKEKGITDHGVVRKLAGLSAMNKEQEEYVRGLRQSFITVVEAAAGCGKSFIALTEGLKMVVEKKIDKVLYIRTYTTSVGCEKDMGFLPGEREDKLAPFKTPIYDILGEFISIKQIDGLFDNQVLEVSNVSFLRGRTLRNTLVIADEFQEADKELLHLVISRLGEGSKIAILCSKSQVDSKKKHRRFIFDFIQLMEQFPEFSSVVLKQCLRNKQLSRILGALEDYNPDDYGQVNYTVK